MLTLTVEQLVAKDLSNLAMLGPWVENIQLHGSYADRRPDLGKMINCPACKRRHRMIGPRCSNAAFATTQRAWDPEQGFYQVACEPRENEAMFGKAIFRKFKHKRHGQNKRNAVRFLTVNLQSDPDALKAAAAEMHVKVPDIAGIPAFAVKYFVWREDREQKQTRRQQDVSNRVRHGLAKPGSRYAAIPVRPVETPRPLPPVRQPAGELPARMPEEGQVSESA